MSGRIQKTKYNMIWLVIYELTVFGCNLILPRMIIGTYGSAYNGLISSVTQFMNFVAIFRLGVAGATRVALYQPLAENDIEKVSSIVKATEIYMRKVGCIIVAFIFALSILYPLLITKEFGIKNTVLIIAAVGACTFSQYFFGITYRTLLQADQKLYINNAVQSAATFLNALLSVCLIVHGFSIQSVKFAGAAVFTIAPVLLNIYTIKKYRINVHAKPDAEALFRKNDVMGQSAANIVHDNTDVIVLTLFAGVEIVSVYTVYHLVIQGIRQILNIFSVGAEAVFGDMWAKGERTKIAKNLNLFEYIISCAIIIVFSVTFVLIIPFVKLYTEGTTDVNYILPVYAGVAVLSQAIYTFRMPYLALVQAVGHYKETKMAAYCEAGINLITSVILVQSIGIVGVGIGTLLANGFRTAHYIFYTNSKILCRKTASTYKRIIWMCGITTGCSAAEYLIAFNRASLSWEYWIGCSIVCCAFSCLILVICSLIFYRADLIDTVKILKYMLRRKS